MFACSEQFTYYKNNHKTEFISVPKVLKALESLRKLNNKYYQFVPDLDKFRDKCEESDVDGFNLLFPNENDEIDQINFTNSEAKPCGPIFGDIVDEIALYSDEEKVNEAEDNENHIDSINKWQFEYNVFLEGMAD